MAIVSSAQAHSGNNSFRYDASADVAGSSFEIADQCGLTSESGEEFAFWVYLDALPLSGDTFAWRLQATEDYNSAPNERIEVEISETGAMEINVEATSGSEVSVTIPGTMPTGSWVDWKFDSTCSEGLGGLFSATLDTGASANAAGDLAPLTFFTMLEIGAATGGSPRFFVDDFTFGAAQAETGDRFCANPSESNFGYDYVEGVIFDDDISGVGISFQDAFLFEGDSSNSEYLAKGYDPGSEAFLVRARLEASGIDGTSSFFRIAFTTGATILAEGAAGDGGADMTAASDGQDGGNFNDHIQVVLQENDDAWLIAAYYNVGGTGLTQIPGTVNYGANPNTATTFQIVVNSGTTDLPTSVENHTIPDIGDQVISVQDGDGDIIFQWQLPAGLFNAEWKDQWFIGKGTGIANSFTYLDDTDQLQDDDSTCLWDLLGTGTRTGSAGLAPGSTIIDPPEDGEGGDGGGFSTLFDPDNIDSQLFIGFLLVAGMVFMGVRQGVGQAAIGALFFVGLFLAYSLGWMPMWVILVIFTISLAAIFVLPRQNKDGV